MKNVNFVAVDFETATPQRAACQIGVIVVKGGEIIEKISRLIQPPGNRYAPMCVKIHGITPAMTADAPTFDDVWKEVKHYFDRNFVVGHNISFDLDVLQKSLSRHNIPRPVFMGTACTYELTGMDLEKSCSTFDIPLCNHHDGACDAEASARLFLKYLNGEMDSGEVIEEGDADEQTTGTGYFREQLHGDVLKKDLTEANPDNPFYDKKLVITGVFDIDRSVLAQQLKNLGADIDTSITKRTDFVLIGEDPGPKKIEKIADLIKSGCRIKKIFEPELVEILSKFSCL